MNLPCLPAVTKTQSSWGQNISRFLRAAAAAALFVFGSYPLLAGQDAGLPHLVIEQPAGASLLSGTIIVLGTSARDTVPNWVIDAKAIAAGGLHSLVLKSDGTVIAAGDNSYGQTSVPAGLTGVQAIGAGDEHSVALRNDGTVIAWGNNSNRQTDVPAGLTGVIAIATSYDHTLALKSNGTVIGWGDNNYGRTSPPAGLSGVQAIAAGSNHSVALKSDGTVVAWGDNSYGQTSVPGDLTGVRAIAAGDSNTVALKSDGTVVAWGRNLSGECNVPAGLSGVKAITSRAVHTVALKNDGTIVAWGFDSSGETTVPADLKGVEFVVAGSSRTLAFVRGTETVSFGNQILGAGSVEKTFILSNSGSAELDISGVTVSGLNSGDFSVNAAGPRVVAAGSQITLLVSFTPGAAGNRTAALHVASNDPARTPYDILLKGAGIDPAVPVITVDPPAGTSFVGTVAAWGASSFRQINVPAGLKAQAIAASGDHSVALKPDGTVEVWGTTYSGFPNPRFPQKLIPDALSGVKAVAAGQEHTLALKIDGTVVAWGRTEAGQSTVPAGLTNVTAIAAAGYQSMALKSDGTIAVWGDKQGEAPAGLAGVQAIAVGSAHTMALKSDGTVVAWSANPAEQTNVPAGLSGVRAIAAGAYHSLALKWDGTVAAWGYNSHGQVNVPDGLRDVQAIAAGDEHSLAVMGDGTVVAWGNNRFGQTNVPAGLTGVQAITAGASHSMALVREAGRILAFGSENIGGEHLSRTFVIRNTGLVTLNVGGVSLSGENSADFSLNTTGMLTSVSPGDQTAFTVTFAPGASGSRTANLRVASNDPTTPLYEFVLKAAGVNGNSLPPVISPHSNVTAQATSAAGALVAYAGAIAIDNAGGTPLITYSRASGTLFPFGETLVTITATDTAGNTSTSTFSVTVQPLLTNVDTTPPVISTHSNVTAQATSAAGALVAYAGAIAIDDAGGTPSITYSRASGTLFPIGETLVTITATDTAGNTSTSTFSVTVQPLSTSVAAPILTVAHPLAGEKFTDKVLVSGLATHELGVVRVEVVLNGSARFAEFAQDGPTEFNWGILIAPEVGSNTIVVTAYDISNTASASIARTFTYSSSIQSIAGSYNGLLKAAVESSPNTIAHQGLVRIAVLASGTFTGKVTLGGSVFPMTGIFLNDGSARFGKSRTATLALAKKTSAGTLPLGELSLTLAAGAERIIGSLTQGQSVVSLLTHADRALYTANQNPVAPFRNVPLKLLDPDTDKGQYTAIFPAGAAPVDGITAFPRGDGWAKVTIAQSGAVRIIGKLADGSVINYANALSKNDELPIYAPLYGNNGGLAGSLQFNPLQKDSDAGSTDMKWYKPANISDKMYPEGWPQGINLEMVASKFVKYLPASGVTVLGIAAPGVAAMATFSDGSLSAPAFNNLSIALNSSVAISGGQGSAAALKLSINPSTGAVSGGFIHPGSGKTVLLSGMVYQKTHAASGFFLYSPPRHQSVGSSGAMSIQVTP